MGRLAMYCATVFCRLEIYVLIPSIPAALVAPPKVGYSHIPSILRRGIFSKIRRAKLW